jgi:hypothetical protein
VAFINRNEIKQRPEMPGVEELAAKRSGASVEDAFGRQMGSKRKVS